MPIEDKTLLSDEASSDAAGEAEHQAAVPQAYPVETAPSIPQDRTLLGMGFYCCSSVFLATMLICAKLLGRRDYPVWQALLARSGSIMTFALIACARQRVNPFGNRRKLLALRGALGFGAIGCYFFAINHLPLNDAMVLTFLAPLFVALLSPLLLKEKPSWQTFLAIPVCIAGVILITQPEALGLSQGKSQRSTFGVVCAIGQAFFSACAKMCVRELRKTDTANVSVFYLSLFSTIGASTGLTIQSVFFGGDWLKLPAVPLDWGLFAGIGLAGYGTQICMTIALQYCKAAQAIAMSYLSVVWGLLGGYFVFHEKPNAMSLAGAAVICSCTFLLGVVSQRQSPPADPKPADPSVASQPATNDGLQEPLLQQERT